MKTGNLIRNLKHIVPPFIFLFLAITCVELRILNAQTLVFGYNFKMDNFFV